jgi:hypothetical protein
MVTKKLPFSAAYFFVMSVILLCLNYGCGSTDSLHGDMTLSHTYLLRDDGFGGKIYNDSQWGSFSDVVSVAGSYCRKRGLDSLSPVKVSDGVVKHYEFKCSPPPTPSLPPEKMPPENVQVNPTGGRVSDIPSQKKMIEDAKGKCSELGFQAGSERHGMCVLELTK